MQRSARRALAIALSAATLGAGCGDPVAGSASRDPDDTDTGVTVALINPGNYPTQPRPPLGVAGTAYRGGLIESRRLAEYLTMPFQVDAELIKQGSGPAGLGVIKNAGATFKAFPPPMPKGADHNFVAGFTVTADTPGGTGRRSLENTVMRFASPQDAAAAVADMADHAARVTPSFGTATFDTTPIAIPGHPDTRAVTYEYENLGSHTVIALSAHGPYVLGQTTISKDGVEDAVALVVDALAQQRPLIDTFKPTPIDKLAELPLDPEGLLARTQLPPPGKTSVSFGLYGPHGKLAFSSNPPVTQALFAETGTDLIARSGTTVHRTRDSAAAAALQEGFSQSVTDQGLISADSPAGLPDAECRRTPQKVGSMLPIIFYCLLRADRYLIEAQSGQLEALHQLISAQYLMLTAK